ncbi:MAG: iron ABC transporter permease [Hahellaceae bacterium]|nr:iron ABC transporter permease [Hahellaceae bacterium]
MVLILSLASLVIMPFLGMTTLSPQSLWMNENTNSLHANIFWNMRLPRVLLAFTAGAALALCGLVYQTLFRNALATPYTLGISGGASLGAALSVVLGLNMSLWGYGASTLCAFLGAISAISIIYGIAKLKGGFSVMTLLLAGVALNFFFSSVILFSQYIGAFSDSIRIMRWLMGGLETVGYESLHTLLPVTVITAIVIFSLTRELNLLSVGEDIASTRGASVEKLKISLFLTTSLQVGTVVALCGPIGFIGMMAPHISRLLVGPDHTYLTITSLLFGGTFLVICDTASRIIIAPAELPVGILTALLGGPFFLWLLINGQNKA